MTFQRSMRASQGPRACGLLASALVLVLAVSALADETPRRDGRLSFEAGPSFDRSEFPNNDRRGYALAAGAELGHAVSLTFDFGFEHYPIDGAPRIVPYNGQTASSLRIEGGGGKTSLSELIGIRVGIPARRVEPFLEAGLGMAAVWIPSPRFLDPATLAVVYPSGRHQLSAPAAEFGAGVRSRREARWNWTLGVRWRGYSQLAEGDHGSSFQVRLGVATR